MSVPEGTGARRPLRTAGFALLGLSVVAGLIGLGLAVSGPEDPSAGGRSPVGPGPGSPSATATTLPASPQPSTVAPAPSLPAGPSPAGPTPAAPPPPAAPPSPPASQPPAPQPAPAAPGTESGLVTHDKAPGEQWQGRGELRVYNNSTIRGLAARAAQDFRNAGWTVVEVGNYSGGVIPTTTVYYEEGTDQRAIAEAVGAQFGMRVEPRFPGIMNATSGLIAIVTSDYGT